MSKSKQFKAYKKLSINLFCLVCIGAGIATASFSYSWFTNTNNVTRNINGYTAGAYFAGGKGEKDDPYIIKNPIHLYNLAWLYYIGYFKGKEPYFRIDKDLDMNGWVLPPVGTSTNPFNGHLNGQEHTITNLTVSNSYNELKERKPSSVSENDWNGTSGKYGDTPNILGLFGYISKESDDKGVPSAENIRINKVNINSTTEKALVGVVAGYVNGSLNGIYIDNSNVNLADNTKALGEFNNKTISSISEYTSVGYCTDTYKTNYNRYETTLYSPKIVGSCTYTLGKEDGGEGGWGGSIDMRIMNRRLNYMYTMGSFVTKNSMLNSKSTVFNTNLALPSYNTAEFYWDQDPGSSYQSTLYIYDNTLIPLNVDETEMGLSNNDTDSETTIAVTNNGTSCSYHVNEKYKQNVGETVKSNNTGYLVGAGDDGYSTYSYFRAGIRPLASGTYKGIYKSLGYASCPTQPTSIEYEKERLELFTLDASGNKFKIKDDINKNFVSENTEMANYKEARYDSEDLNLKKYKVVREGLDNMLNGSTEIHGFHFQKVLKSTDYKTVKSTAQIAGVTYDESNKYEFVKGGLNFTVSKQGYITAVLAGCFTSGNHSMFDLFKIERDSSNHSVKSIKQIDKVYENAQGEIEYDPDSTENKTLKYEFKKYTQSGFIPQGSAFYVEIPVSEGDYLLGTASDSSSSNAYLMYLDIGANGDEGSTSETITRTKVFELLEQITQVFTYPTGVYVADFDNAVLDAKTLCITLGSTYSGKASISRTKENAELSVISSSDNQTGVGYYDSDLSLTDTDGKALSDDSYLTTNKTISYEKRMTYYDYSTKNSTLTMFRFSQTSTDGGNTYSTVSAETQYQATYETALSDWTKLETSQTVYNDDGKETEGIPTEISTSITQPEDIKDNNVFNLKLKDSCEGTFTNTYLPKATLSTDFITSINGYDFVMKNGDTSISSDNYNLDRNEDYYLKINDDEYAAA